MDDHSELLAVLVFYQSFACTLGGGPVVAAMHGQTIHATKEFSSELENM